MKNMSALTQAIYLARTSQRSKELREYLITVIYQSIVNDVDVFIPIDKNKLDLPSCKGVPQLLFVKKVPNLVAFSEQQFIRRDKNTVMVKDKFRKIIELVKRGNISLMLNPFSKDCHLTISPSTLQMIEEFNLDSSKREMTKQ
ncbi:MAG: hypothetical protein IK065_00865 [Neisseriaceae bacterium]|nr:hypothetical protein [Neisseriaceae bacterium]